MTPADKVLCVVLLLSVVSHGVLVALVLHWLQVVRALGVALDRIAESGVFERIGEQVQSALGARPAPGFDDFETTDDDGSNPNV